MDYDKDLLYQLPHMTGKYCADVEVRIDELKESTMTDSEKHHAKLDELIDDARKEMHLMMDRAMLSGAVSHGMAQPDTYFLARAIITIYGDERYHAPPSISMNKETDNLAKVLHLQGGIQMSGSQQPTYMCLDEYHAEHPTDLARIRDVMLESMISSVEVDNGDLRLNYVDGNIDIIQREEFIEKISTDNTPCIENCTSCLDTKCVFHETNRDTEEYKELAQELRRKIVGVSK